jgi:hypothetical protein
MHLKPVRSWRERVEVLENLGFVRAKTTPHGSYRYILILDPHKVIDNLEKTGKISEEHGLALNTLLISIGAVR